MAEDDRGNAASFLTAATGLGCFFAKTWTTPAQTPECLLTDSRWKSWHPIVDLAAVVGLFLVLVMLLTRPGGGAVPRLSENSLAQVTIKAGRDVLVEYPSAAKVRQARARAAVLENFDYDSDHYYSLDDYNLTLKDLTKIETAFTRTLALGVYHNWVDYPPMAGPNNLPSYVKGNNGTNSDADEYNRIHTMPGVVERST